MTFLRGAPYHVLTRWRPRPHAWMGRLLQGHLRRQACIRLCTGPVEGDPASQSLLLAVLPGQVLGPLCTRGHMVVATLGNVTLNALTYPPITAVAEGSFHIMKDLLTPDWCLMSHDSQIGYLLAMINGDVKKRIPA